MLERVRWRGLFDGQRWMKTCAIEQRSNSADDRACIVRSAAHFAESRRCLDESEQSRDGRLDAFKKPLLRSRDGLRSAATVHCAHGTSWYRLSTTALACAVRGRALADGIPRVGC